MFLLMRQMVRRRGCNYSIVNRGSLSDIPLHILACECQFIKRLYSNSPILIELDEE